MMRKSRKLWLFLSFLFALVISFLVLYQGRLSKYLSETRRVNANILLVEGWVPPNTIESASKEFSQNNYDLIITTGLELPDFYPVVMNGYLVFYTDSLLNDFEDNLEHKIEVLLYSEMGGKHCSHFNFYVNDRLKGDFCAGKIKKRYAVNYSGSLCEIDSIMIQFDNDSLGDFGDHNLYVSELIIDNETVISYKNNSLYNRTARGWEKRIRINYSTFAERTRNNLVKIGIDPSMVISVPGNNLGLNRTLSSALAFRDWLMLTDSKIQGINIISSGAHAKRTWMTYHKILGESYQVGIISSPVGASSQNTLSRFLNNLKELFSLCYYRLILLPYDFPGKSAGVNQIEK